MPATTGFTNSFKLDLLNKAGPDFGDDVLKFCLILAAMAGTYNKAWTNAGTPGTGTPSASNIGTDAAPASGDYTPRAGMAWAFSAPAIYTGSPDKAITHPTGGILLSNTNFNSGGVGAIRALCLFNSSNANKSIWVWDFGLDVTTLNGTLELEIPAVSYANGMFKVG